MMRERALQAQALVLQWPLGIIGGFDASPSQEERPKLLSPSLCVVPIGFCAQPQLGIESHLPSQRDVCPSTPNSKCSARNPNHLPLPPTYQDSFQRMEVAEALTSLRHSSPSRTPQVTPQRDRKQIDFDEVTTTDTADQREDDEHKSERYQSVLRSVHKNAIAAQIDPTDRTCATSDEKSFGKMYKSMVSSLSTVNAHEIESKTGHHSISDMQTLTTFNLSPRSKKESNISGEVRQQCDESKQYGPSSKSVAEKPSLSTSKQKVTFPQKLMDVLLNIKDDEAFEWLPDGKSFVVIQPELFVSRCLPHYLSECKYPSFTRQLNRWGFTRITSGTGIDCFYHKFFQRDNRDLCRKMICLDRKTGTNSEMARRRRESRSRSIHISKRIALAKDRAKKFPQKLMDVLLNIKDDEAFEWLPDGKSFVVIQPELFVSRCLPHYLSECKYPSFTRQLNRWGFSRMASGTGVDCFYHEFFQRDNRDLCRKMICLDRKTSAEIDSARKKIQTEVNDVNENVSKVPSLKGIELMVRKRKHVVSKQTMDVYSSLLWKKSKVEKVKE